MSLVIEAKNITKNYKSGQGSLCILNDLYLAVPKGQFLSITGKSGSGKSTLLYQLGLLDMPNGGEININGVNVTRLSTAQRTSFRLNKLGYIFQDYALIPELTAIENVALPLMMQGVHKHAAINMAYECLRKVGLGDRKNNLPDQLSGGQQQRVSIARAIVHNPDIVFADEPTANLDSEMSRNVMKVFQDLNKGGQTIIMVTHEKDYADLAQRVIVLSDGKIISDIIKSRLEISMPLSNI